jgi:DMSO/TMAO reductase YedYZ molybdopterin-dependent catalytic subunit
MSTGSTSAGRLGPDGWARGPVVARRVTARADRPLPPGQSETRKWPILQYGSVPPFDPARWDFRVYGEVERPLAFGYAQLLARDRVELVADIHCVTQWTRFATSFEGAPVADLLAEAGLKPAGRFALIHAEQSYTTNLPLDALLAEEALLADWADGAPLTPEHGYPLRLVVPSRYFWKSAKWVRAIEILPADRPGFWERAGYHNDADPWREERFG